MRHRHPQRLLVARRATAASPSESVEGDIGNAGDIGEAGDVAELVGDALDTPAGDAPADVAAGLPPCLEHARMQRFASALIVTKR